MHYATVFLTWFFYPSTQKKYWRHLWIAPLAIMLVLIVIYGIAPKIQEEKRPLLYIGAGITFILIVINIAIGFYIKDKYCKKNEIEASEKQEEEGPPKKPSEE